MYTKLQQSRQSVADKKLNTSTKMPPRINKKKKEKNAMECKAKENGDQSEI